MHIVNNKSKMFSKNWKDIQEIFKTSALLPKTCSLFILSKTPEDVSIYDNMLKILGKILPSDYSQNIIIKNI